MNPQQLGDYIKASRLGGLGQAAYDTNLTGSSTAGITPTTGVPDPGQQTVATSSSGAVMQGIGAILAPLATAGVGIFQAQLQADLAKAQMKAQQKAAAQTPQVIYAPAPAQKSNLGLILAMVGGIGLLGVVLMFALKGGKPKATSSRRKNRRRRRKGRR